MPKHYTVVLPDIGEGVVEGEVIEWLKKIDDDVKQDEPVVVVMTDKATVELPAPYPGKIVKHYYKPGEIAIKGKPLYDISLNEGVHAQQQKEEQTSFSAPKSKLKEKTTSSASSLRQQISTGKKGLATPPVRKLAKQLGINIDAIPASGKDGQVTLEDVRHFQGEIKAAPFIPHTPLHHLQEDMETPMIGIRKMTAERMVESKTIIPHFSYFDQLDATRLIQLRNNLKKRAQQEKISLSYMPFFIRALSFALQKYPQVNASVDLEKNSILIHKQHNVGIAINTRNGLIVPVLKHVEAKSLEEIIREFHQLKIKALSSKLDPSDMQDSTITISNFGTLGGGGLFATPIINYPEAAILGVAKIKKQPVVKNDEIVSRDILNLSWSFDHRIIDGDTAAFFSAEFVRLLENPSSIL